MFALARWRQCFLRPDRLCRHPHRDKVLQGGPTIARRFSAGSGSYIATKSRGNDWLLMPTLYFRVADVFRNTAPTHCQLQCEAAFAPPSHFAEPRSIAVPSS
jgi:hypothetical protein